MNRKICTAAAIQKYKTSIRIKQLVTHEGGKQFNVCEMKPGTEEVRVVHETAPSWDALFSKLTGVKHTQPKADVRRRKGAVA